MCVASGSGTAASINQCEKRRKNRRGRRRGEERRKSEREKVLGKESEQVDEDVTGWVEVRRRIRRRAVGRRDNDEDVKSRELVQIFVKMDGSRTVAMDVSQNDKVGDMMNRILNGVDMYLTSGGSVLRRSDKLRSCGASDGSTLEVMSKG